MFPKRFPLTPPTVKLPVVEPILRLYDIERLPVVQAGVSVVRLSKKENEICKILKKMGYQIESSFKIETKICDVYIPKLNLIIEYFGDYWHCNPNKYIPEYLLQSQ